MPENRLKIYEQLALYLLILAMIMVIIGVL